MVAPVGRFYVYWDSPVHPEGLCDSWSRGLPHYSSSGDW